MADLADLHGKLCVVHNAEIVVGKSGNNALCRGGDYSQNPKCDVKVLRAYAASLNGHVEGGDANGRSSRPRKDDESPAIEGRVGSGRSGKASAPADGTEALWRRGGSANVQDTNSTARRTAQARPSRQSGDLLARLPPQDLEAEMSVLGAILLAQGPALETVASMITPAAFHRETHREIYKAMLAVDERKEPIDAITLCNELRAQPGRLEAVGGPGYLAELAACVPTAANVAHYAHIVSDKAALRTLATIGMDIAQGALENPHDVREFMLRVDRQLSRMNALVPASDREIVWEGYDEAEIANAEYLKRTPIIDKLCYSSAVSLITGGKHAGKSTLARWMAICVAKGWEVLGRQVTQGPVFYIASEDETMAARQELIRLGWHKSDPLRFYPAQNMDDPDKFLRKLTDEIRRYDVKFVVLDMLFDFVRIADEMSYAGTREALGKIQNVASESGAHIVPIHHAPKNAAIGDAAVAALGSQGLAARVSPIILVRRFGPGVHSISSTSVRDPRGEALIESRLLKNEDGSVVLGGAFKNYMLAEVYAERVLDVLDEDGAEYTAMDIASALDISYQVASKCLSLLYKQGVVGRRGDGKKRRPFTYAKCISAPNDSGEGSGYMASPKTAIDMNPLEPGETGRFGYKD